MSFSSNDHLPHPHHTADTADPAFAAHRQSVKTPVETAHDDPAPAPGRVRLDASLLRRLRQARFMSQQDLADDCWRRNIQLSLSTIKRAEGGRAVRFRIAREFARCFDVSTVRIACSEHPISTLCDRSAS